MGTHKNTDNYEDGWEAHRIAQLCRFRALSLRQKLEAVEEMADVAGRLGEMRRERAFHSSAGEPFQGGGGTKDTVCESQADYQPAHLSCNLALPGCTPEPLMAYLKALGILRLISEQKDSEVRGWWKNDVFWLRTPGLFKDATTQEAKRDTLMKFFLEEYRPTPIFSPWNGDGGFLSDTGTSVGTIKAIRESSQPRLKPIRDAITEVEQIPLMAEFREKRDRSKELEKMKKELKKKKKELSESEEEERKQVAARVKQIKQSVVDEIRAGFPDSSLNWLDACMTLNMDGFTPSRLLGSGGVDGHLDFGTNFLVNIQLLLTDQQESVWLPQALFGKRAHLAKSSIGQFSPGQIGGPNGTQGFEGTSLINLWDFVLMMEGSLLLAGAAVRRFGAIGKSRATFPFTVRAIAAGFDSSAPKDEAESHGEVWLPLWTRPTSAGELRQLFGEGRAEVSGRSARAGTDFARAIAELGVDRGIAGFSRLGFLKRSGKAFLATPLGRFAVVERPGADLLREVTPWLDDFRWKCARGRDKEEAPKRILSTLNGIDSAILDFCKYGGTSLFQNIVVALGRAECELRNTEGKFKRKVVNPIRTLSAAWVAAANDGCREFTIARALASLHDTEDKIGPLRTNLEAVNWKKRCRAWAEKDRTVVWNAGSLATNLANVLQRRMMDGQRAGCKRLPLASRFAVSLNTVAAFLNHELDDQRIADLIWGMMLIGDSGSKSTDHQKANHLPLPRVYALLKLLFLPRPLVADRMNGALRWRLARNGEEGLIIRPEPRILPLLCAGRVGEACRIAAQRLRASGLAPMPCPLSSGKTRDHSWAEYSVDHPRAQRLGAALLIPIDSHSVNYLVHVVCRDQSVATAASRVPTTEGEFA
jgi:CRISPR-associated protein Csx17